jgi:hypothetical protein
MCAVKGGVEKKREIPPIQRWVARILKQMMLLRSGSLGSAAIGFFSRFSGPVGPEGAFGHMTVMAREGDEPALLGHRTPHMPRSLTETCKAEARVSWDQLAGRSSPPSLNARFRYTAC